MNTIKNDNVISTVAIVLNGVISHIVDKLSGISVIYDENLGYDTGARLLRDSNNLRDEFSNRLPAIFFRRSVLRPQEEGISRRSITERFIDPVSSTTANMYRTIAGVFDLEFLYVTTKISQMENFEISWLTESTIGSEKELRIDIPTVGEFPFFIRYNLLDDKVINSQGNYYKTLTGTMNVRGFYLILEPNQNGTLYKLINQIQKNIYNETGTYLEGEIIS